MITQTYMKDGSFYVQVNTGEVGGYELVVKIVSDFGSAETRTAVVIIPE